MSRRGTRGVLEPRITVVRVDAGYFRPTEVATLLGDAGKARERLGWEASVVLPELVQKRVWDDLGQAQRDELCKSEGFVVREERD